MVTGGEYRGGTDWVEGQAANTRAGSAAHLGPGSAGGGHQVRTRPSWLLLARTLYVTS